MQQLFAQTADHHLNARSTFSAGYLTTNSFFSLNYDHIVHRSLYWSTSLSAGFAAAKNRIGFPVGLYLINGQHHSHIEYSVVFLAYIEQYQYLFQAGNRSDKKAFIIPAIGYRYQKREGGFFFRIAASPIVALDPRSDNFWKMDGKLLPGCSVGAGASF